MIDQKTSGSNPDWAAKKSPNRLIERAFFVSLTNNALNYILTLIIPIYMIFGSAKFTSR